RTTGHETARHHAARAATTGRNGRVRSGRERAQGPVENVERRCPAGVALAHDDARTDHRDRQPLPPVRDKALRLELRLLVGVAEALSHVEVVLAEAPRVLAGDEGRRDVREAPQAPPRL